MQRTVILENHEKGGTEMKRTVFLLVLLLIGVALGFAQTEVDVWELRDGSWVQIVPKTAGNARLFASMSRIGSCNKVNWSFEFTTEAQIAQWVEWSISGTKLTWFVRKPGDYFTNGIEFVLKSNGDVELSASGFGNLQYQGEYSVNPEIVTYWFGTVIPGYVPLQEDWVSAAEVNTFLSVPDSGELHEGLTAYLWNRIVVVNCNSASTYSDTGTITITLKNQKPWITDDGEYVSDLTGYVTTDR